MSGPVILALDPSSRATGWACSDGPRAGVWRPSEWHMARASEPARHAALCGRAMLWLADMLTEHAPSVLVIEIGGGRMTDRCSERLRGALLGTAYVREVAVDTVYPVTWQAWAKRELGWSLADKDDERDAMAILAWWQAVRAPMLETAA